MQKIIVYGSVAICLVIAVFFLVEKNSSDSDGLIREINDPARNADNVRKESDELESEHSFREESFGTNLTSTPMISIDLTEEKFIGPEIDLDEGFIEYAINEAHQGDMHIGEEIAMEDYELYMRINETEIREIGAPLDESQIDHLDVNSSGVSITIGEPLDIENYLLDQYKKQKTPKHIGKELEVDVGG